MGTKRTGGRTDRLAQAQRGFMQWRRTRTRRERIPERVLSASVQNLADGPDGRRRCVRGAARTARGDWGQVARVRSACVLSGGAGAREVRSTGEGGGSAAAGPWPRGSVIAGQKRRR